jgi:hypothetical protein
MKTLAIFEAIIVKMPRISKHFRTFLSHLILVFLSGKGRNNFLNMSRWSALHEKTFRRNYVKTFDFKAFNQCLIDLFYPNEPFIAALDCSFINKSGKHSYGLGKFWSGTAQKALKGLEISMIALVGLSSKVCFSFCTEQTPSELTDENRIDFYLRQLKGCATHLLKKTKYLVADGFYAKERFMEGVLEAGFQLITKLRKDADMRYVYEGEQKGRGRKRKQDGKVKWNDFGEIEKRFMLEGTTAQGDTVYSQILWSVKWKKKVKVAYIQQKGTKNYAILVSTEVSLSGMTIVSYYSLRFQIEFLFRDAKQELGLEDCQSIKEKCLDFHFNAVMMTLNLTRQENYLKGNKIFSLYDIKTGYFNEKCVENIITNLGLDLHEIKLHPNYDEIIKKGRKVV